MPPVGNVDVQFPAQVLLDGLHHLGPQVGERWGQPLKVKNILRPPEPDVKMQCHGQDIAC